MTRTTLNTFFIVLFVLFLVEFFHLTFFPYQIFFGSLRVLFYLLPIFLLSKKKIWKGNILGKRLFVLYLLFSVINIVSCYFFRGQNPYISFVAWAQMYYIFYYFTFRTWKQPIFVWERVVEYIYIILLVLFALKNTFLDWNFIMTDLVEERLETERRVRIFSDAFLEFGYLYCLNKYLTLKNLKYLILAILGAFFIFLQGFRMMMVMGTLISLIMLIRVYNLSLRTSILTITLTSLSILLASQLPIVKDRLIEIESRNENANFGNSDYVRVRDVNYTYKSFFHNRLEMILGAGKTFFWNMNNVKENHFPSKYSKERTILATNDGYFPVDLGFLGLSWEAGIPFTIVAIFLFLYLWKFKVDKSYYYLSCYGLYMILIGGTNAQGYYQANLIRLAIAYTIVEIANNSYKKRFLLLNKGCFGKNEDRNNYTTSK